MPAASVPARAHDSEDLPVAPLAESGAPAPRLPKLDGHSKEALHAVRASIFGLTEVELAETLSLSTDESSALIARLVSEGRLARRGRRLVAGAAAEETGAQGRS
ncbi:MAG: hypothetical protein JST92_27230 [Deltaproteobacteria bacterium]|nr:hypothetical protein [Deltaproteobacteria bacterium]